MSTCGDSFCERELGDIAIFLTHTQFLLLSGRGASSIKKNHRQFRRHRWPQNTEREREREREKEKKGGRVREIER